MFSQGEGSGGGQGWRDAQWETVLQLVANLITPESPFSVRWSSRPPHPPHPHPIITSSRIYSHPPNPTSSFPRLLPHFATFW